MERARLLVFATVFFVVVLCGTIGFVLVEGFSPVDALYFSIVTMSTVGYGDIHPWTTTGKFLAIALILSGGGTFFGILASAAEMFLGRRETRNRRDKLHIIIGLFFSELGVTLIRRFSRADPGLDALRASLSVDFKWSRANFQQALRTLDAHANDVDIAAIDLPGLKDLLSGHSEFLVRVLENPNIVEHEAFTELLLAVFHLKEELAHRRDLTNLPDTDLAHLRGDIRRVYDRILPQWLSYLDYVKDNYPYLFSHEVRITPFFGDGDATVRG